MRLWTVPLHPSFFTLSFGHGSLCGQLAFGASGGSACSRRPGHTLCHWRHCGRWTCPLLDHQLPSPSSLAWPVACGPAAGLDAWVAHALRGRLLTGRHIDTRQGTARFPWRRLRAGLHQPQGCARAASGIPDSFGNASTPNWAFPVTAFGRGTYEARRLRQPPELAFRSSVDTSSHSTSETTRRDGSCSRGGWGTWPLPALAVATRHPVCV